MKDLAVQYEETLRRVVKTALRNEELLTVRIIRDTVEKELDLEVGFFKNDPLWKGKSKDIITSALNEDDNESCSSSLVRERKNGNKRLSAELESSPAKRIKKSETMTEQKNKMESVSSNGIRTKMTAKSDIDAKKRSRPSKKVVNDSDDEDTGVTSEAEVEEQDEAATNRNKIETEKVLKSKTTSKEADGDESDMSSLIDDTPPKKKRQKQDAKPKKSTKADNKKKTATKAKPSADLTPDEESIKTLQSQLLKCGVRKLWHRELSQCDTPKDKIRHLKKMLEDVGMTGRFSAEKASQIKEARELAADVEAAQGFEKSWGSEATIGRPRRSAARKNIVIDDNDEDDDGNDDDDQDQDQDQIQAGTATGLVDFGDSGDDSSE